MLVNAANLDTLFIAFKTAFNQGFTALTPAYKSIAMVVSSSTREEQYGWLGQFPRMREWIGPRVVNNLSMHGFNIKNRDFEQTISVSRNDIQDDRVGIYGPMFNELGLSAAELPDQLVFGLLAGGFNGLCYDGQYFFDADHPVLNAAGATTSVSNIQAGSSEPWFLLDTSRAVKPLIYQERMPLGKLVAKDKDTDDNVFLNKEYLYGSDGRCNVGYGLWQLAYASKQPLTAENYETARAAMMSQVGDSGRPLGVKPNILVCGPNNEGAAMRLLNNGSRVVQVDNGDDTTTPVAVQNEWANTAKPLITQWLLAA
jgi:phage major head subunit gpT-like protein